MASSEAEQKRTQKNEPTRPPGEQGGERAPEPKGGSGPWLVLLMWAVVLFILLGGIGFLLVVVSRRSNDGQALQIGANGPEVTSFVGRKAPYRVRLPPGAGWHALSEAEVKKVSPIADSFLVRRVGDQAAVVLVIVEDLTISMTVDEAASVVTQPQAQTTAVEITRAPLQKGEDRGLLLHVRYTSAGGADAREGFIALYLRDDLLYTVHANAPAAMFTQLEAALEGIARDIELPPVERIEAPPAPPFALAEPPAPSPTWNGRTLRDEPPGVLLSLANQAAARGAYPEAATFQHWAVIKGSAREHHYNLACYEARSGHVDAAFHWLQRAAHESGVDPDWAEEDADLASARSDPRWPRLRSHLRRMARYWSRRPLDAHVIAVPKAVPSGQALPAVAALHGLGSDPENFAGAWFQPAADSLSIALVSVSATTPRGPHSFVWTEDVERDRARVEKALSALEEKTKIAAGKLVLIGFSQGAQMAAEIAARYPERYAGAIVMSPGSRDDLRDLRDVPPGVKLGGRRFVVVVNAGEHPGTVTRAAKDAERLRALGAEVIHKAYPDVTGHTLPPDFERAFPQWVRFILDGVPPQ